MNRAVLAAAVSAACAALYVLRLDPSAGLFVDDAWYIVLATSIAEGHGFRLISSATTPIMPAFPPGFPALLAPIVAVAPRFPDNVLALKAVSMAAMSGVAVATYWYLARVHEAPRRVAAVVTVITVMLPAFVFLTTSTVMAEPVFACAQLALALAVERAARADDRAGLYRAGVCGAVAGLTMLIRMAGVAGVAAGGVYLFLRRGTKSAVVFTAIAMASFVPWALYAAANQPTPAERLAHGGSAVYSYSELLVMRRGGEGQYGTATLAELPSRALENLGNVFGRDVGAMILPAAYRGPEESGQEVFGMSGEGGPRASSMGGARETFAVSMVLSAVVLAGYALTVRRRITFAECLFAATIAMVVLVPARTFRYVLPLAPFVVFYFFAGLDAVVAAIRRREHWRFGAPFRIASACVLALMTVEHAQYVWASRQGPAPVWLQEYRESLAVTDRIRTLPHEGFVVSNNPGLVYLATGRKGLSMGDAAERWQDWLGLGVRYAAAVLPAEKPHEAVASYRTVYESPNRLRWLLDLGSDTN